MKYRSRRPFVRSAVVLWAVLTCTHVSAGAQAPSARSSQSLLLSVVVNGVPRPSLHEVQLEGDRLVVAPETLRELGVRQPAAARGNRVILGDVPGWQVDYRVERQVLHLAVPPSDLDGLRLRLTAGLQHEAVPDPRLRVPGTLLNYDLFVQRTGATTSLSAQLEARALAAGPGVASQALVARSLRGPSGSSVEVVRLHSNWRMDLPELPATVALGDTLTSSLAWARPMRIAGIQVGRDLGLQPYRSTSPLLSLGGEAALPSTVELLINGVRQLSQPVQPGVFQVDAVPSVTGSGSAQLLVTDANGRVQRTQVDFYAVPGMLAQGLWEGAIEWGYPRYRFGIASNDYASQPATVATGRYGLHDDVTMEGRAEVAAGVSMLGAGAQLRLPAGAGLMNLSAARSSGPDGEGWQRSIGHQFVNRLASMSLSMVERSPGYRDAAAAFDGPPARSQASAGFGVRTPVGHLSVGWVSQKDRLLDGSLMSVSVLRQLPSGVTLRIAALETRSSAARSRSLTFSMSMPLAGGHATASVERASRREGASMEFTRNPASDAGGVGYRLQAVRENGRSGADAQVTWLNEAGQWFAGASQRTETHVHAGGSGALLIMDGRLRSLPRATDGFAVVSTSGVPDVTVRLENRPVGRTDGRGTLVVPRLNAYQRNRLSIDTEDLPAEYRVDEVVTQAVPARGSGVAVRFGVRRVNPVQFTLTDRRGQPVAAGTPLRILDASGSEERTVVGRDGFVYIEHDGPWPLTLHAEPTGVPCLAVLATGNLPAGPGDGRPSLPCQ